MPEVVNAGAEGKVNPAGKVTVKLEPMGIVVVAVYVARPAGTFKNPPRSLWPR